MEGLFTIYFIVMIYLGGIIISWAIIMNGDKYNPAMCIIWPIVFLVLLFNWIIIAFKEIPKIWKM